MQVVKHYKDVAAIRNPVMRDFLAKRITAIAPDWVPYTWDMFGQFLVLEAGDDPRIVESVDCTRLVSAAPLGPACLGDDDFVPIWDWVDDHGSFYEVGLVIADAGDFQAVLIPKSPGTSPALLQLCERNLTQQAALAIASSASTVHPLAD